MSPATIKECQSTFDHTTITVIFVLSGPGAGKGTQCVLLVEKFGFCHISAGDLLCSEQAREGSQYGELIRTHIREGKIVPMQITIALLKDAMTAALSEGRCSDGWGDGKGRFLVDSFPRKLDQALDFEDTVYLSSGVMFFRTEKHVMKDQLLEREKTSEQSDDNIKSILKHFDTYEIDTMPVLDHYRTLGKVIQIDSNMKLRPSINYFA